jgi:hypothetical protein
VDERGRLLRGGAAVELEGDDLEQRSMGGAVGSALGEEVSFNHSLLLFIMFTG